MSDLNFVHLHNHTHYSLLDGLTKVDALVDFVVEQGMPAVAMTDHGTLSGLVDLYKTAHAKGVKPILGMEAYMAPRKLTDKEAGKDKQYYHLIILAKNNEGYKNLMKLSTIANLEGYYYKPRIDRDTLKKHSKGLIILSGCIGGELGDAVRYDNYEKAEQIIEWYREVFKDDYYIEVQDHGHPDHPHKWTEQVRVNKGLFELAKKHKVRTVITSDAHYLKHEDQEAHEILLCVQTGSFIDDEGRMSLKEFELHVAPKDEIIARWQGTSIDSIKASVEIADKCEVTLELGGILIPKFPVPEGLDEKGYLHVLVYQGLAYRYGEVSFIDKNKLTIEEAKKTLPPDILKRSEYELSVIDGMGFNGYFLIIWDFINWGKEQGIVFGPGRGSAAGSIVAFALRITELDPMKYELLFERFLNPDRISMPDIDIDIQDTRRDEVIDYCVRKYGKDRVANIVTFGKMAARNAVRDVARVLKVSYADSDRLAKMIPPPVQGRHILLAKSLVDDEALRNEYQTNPVAKMVFDQAVKLEGTIRSHGIHAAGVVIAPSSIVEYAPLEIAQKGVVSTQYSMNPVEELGLLKMDFLGLKNLTVINNAIRIIKRVYKVDIDLSAIPFDDPMAFDLLASGLTTGVFQLESSGMKKYLKELKPTEFDDIVAMCALYRPGPLGAGLVDTYIRRKNKLEPVVYDHPKMEAALKNTYGVLVYQEQFMQISKDVCGFTGGEADTLRKAIGKKKRDVMEKMATRFIEGAVENGIDRKLIEDFWAKLLGFADYCFNKSHSACYGLIAYWTAYLKAHYASAFMAAVMTSDYDDIDRLNIEISECVQRGIKVLPPDVNHSFHEFAVYSEGDPNTDSIKFGMDAIKNIGHGAVEDIINKRNEMPDNKFETIEEFLQNINTRIVNKKTLESLVKSGALDEFGDRVLFLNNLDVMVAYAQNSQKMKNSGQIDLFASAGDEAMEISRLTLLPIVEKFSSLDILKFEKDLMGLYLSSHPLAEYQQYLAENSIPIKEVSVELDNKRVSIGGMITQLKLITTKNNQVMAFLTVSGEDGDIEIICFPGTYNHYKEILVLDTVVIVKGKVSARDKDGNITSDIKILAEDILKVDPDAAKTYQKTEKTRPKASSKVTQRPSANLKSKNSDHEPKKEKSARLYLRLIDSDDDGKLIALKEILDDHIGEMETILVMGQNNLKPIRLPNRISPSPILIEALQKLFGPKNVQIT